MAEPDRQIKGGGGHPDPEIKGGGAPGLPKNCFRPFGPQFGLKISGGGGGGEGGSPVPFPRSTTARKRKTNVKRIRKRSRCSKISPKNISY